MSNGSDLYDFGSMVIIRQKFLKITERNLCTSSVLDRLYAEVTTKLEDAWYEIEHYNKKFDSIAKFSVNLLYIYQCEVFTKEEIVEALNFLIKKEYIRVVDQQHNTYSFYVDMQKIDRETTPPPLRQEDITEQDVVQMLEESSRYQETPKPAATQEREVPPTQESPKPQRRSESRRVEYHNNRAARVGLSATLTIQQWIQTLDYFKWRCALCPDGSYEVLEHFTPIIHGGGTTDYNCIPACAQCNRLKHDSHPSMISPNLSMSQVLQTVQKYLESRRVKVEEVAE